MRIDWATMLTVFLAIVLAELFVRGMFSGGSIGGTSTSVGAMTHSPAQPTIIYTSKIDQYIHENYPNARR